MKKNLLFVTIASLFCFSFVSANALAEEIAFDDKNSPTVDEVVNALKPDDTVDIKLRGINYKPEPAEPKMISVELQFEKNSSTLTANTQKSLSMVGQALNSEDLKELKFILEGHADATGTSDYNMELSQKRAETVKMFLVDQYNISPENLVAVGKGETDLLDAGNPDSKKNRRVRIITAQ